MVDRCGIIDSLLHLNGDWNLDMLNQLFDKDSVNNIKKIFWVNLDLEDEIIWTGSSSGRIQIKSVSKLLNSIATGLKVVEVLMV